MPERNYTISFHAAATREDPERGDEVVIFNKDRHGNVTGDVHARVRGRFERQAVMTLSARTPNKAELVRLLESTRMMPANEA